MDNDDLRMKTDLALAVNGKTLFEIGARAGIAQEQARDIACERLDGFSQEQLREILQRLKERPKLDWSACPLVEIDPERCSGAVTLRGTRTPLAIFFSYLADNKSVSEFLWDYPGYDRDGIEALLNHLEKSCEAPKRKDDPAV